MSKVDRRRYFAALGCMLLQSMANYAVQALVTAGDDVNETDDILRTPLLYAITSGNLETVEYLIENGADIHYDKCMDNFTPLFTAAEFGFVEIFRLLVYKGCDFQLAWTKQYDSRTRYMPKRPPCRNVKYFLFDKNHEVELGLSVDGFGRTMVQICKDAVDRNPKPHNQVSLAARSVKSKIFLNFYDVFTTKSMKEETSVLR